jgi:hypothetical protein
MPGQVGQDRLDDDSFLHLDYIRFDASPTFSMRRIIAIEMPAMEKVTRGLCTGRVALQGKALCHPGPCEDRPTWGRGNPPC